MSKLLLAKKTLYANGLFKAISQYRDILKRATDGNFWDDPKNIAGAVNRQNKAA